MIRHPGFGLVEPEMGNLREHLALARDAVGHDAVEGRNAVSGDEEQRVAEVEDLPDLAGGDAREGQAVDGGDRGLRQRGRDGVVAVLLRQVRELVHHDIGVRIDDGAGHAVACIGVHRRFQLGG